MSENLKKYSFQDLIQQTKVRIPKIQRDYAQGRICRNVNEIRKDFIHTLMLVVKGKRSETELDFIYGSNKDGAFEPLDGQQRLTTLFLLHWMMGVKLNMTERNQSIFTYETRNTSQEFCDEIVLHTAMQYVNEAILKEKSTNEIIKPSKIIRNRDWFKFEWRNDPTIGAMLVMIDAIYDEMGGDWSMDLDICRRNLSNITFHMLNLGDFGLSNELFIKMNARGKQLSDFDKLKSTLEEELQLQQREKNEDGCVLSTRDDETNWRTFMDGAWIDFFWHKYAREIIVSTEQASEEHKQEARLFAAKNVEKQFRKLILRLIALQIFEDKQSNENLQQAAYKIDESDIDNLITTYNDSLTELRSDAHHCIVPKTQIVIDFKKLMTDINHLIFLNKNGVLGEISELLSDHSHIEKNETTLFDAFLTTKVSNDVELIFYAMLLFLRNYPIQTGTAIAHLDDISTNGKWFENFQDWVFAMRNILLNNNNNQHIDKLLSSLEATQSLCLVIDDLKAFIEKENFNIYEDENVVSKFFMSTDKTYKRLDNQSFEEERKKARLKLSDLAWCQAIEKIEDHHYLWGQIRCVLNWASDDIVLFYDYGKRLICILDAIEAFGSKFYAALLAFAPDCWSETNRLYQYNKVRDNSFKRCLREPGGQKLFKSFIDNWREQYNNKAIAEYLDSLVSKTIDAPETPPWLKCILKHYEIIDYASYKRIYVSNGHIILAERKTPDSHCIDPILKHLAICCQENGYTKQYELFDSKGVYTHAFEFINNAGKKYLVQWADSAGEYSIKIDDNNPVSYNANQMLSTMENVIKKI